MPSTDTLLARRPAPAVGAAGRKQRELLEQAVALLRAKELAAAEQLLNQVLQRFPGQPDALHFLGVLKHAQGDSTAAVGLIRRAIAAMPGEPGPWNNLGNVLVETQQFDEAETAFRQALRIQPEHGDALNNLATICSKRGDHAEAEALCRRAIVARPDFGQAWYNLSVALLGQKRITEGLEANSRAILLWPKHLQARDAVARALVHLGRLEDAATLYREWLAVDPDNPVIRHHLAACSGAAVPARASDAYVARTFDAFAASFDANLSALGYRAPALVAGLLHELLPATGRALAVLDLGCGTGLCGPLVRDRARHLSGCDLSAGMLEKARRRQVYDALHQAELVAHLNAHKQSFDALVCADTLCYFGDLAEALGAAAGALRRGGVLVFTVESLADGHQAGFALLPHGRYAHHADHLRQALRQGGLLLREMRQEVLRQEAGRPVVGWLVGAARPEEDRSCAAT
jgi:predicted TPR repeat methyltransferase